LLVKTDGLLVIRDLATTNGTKVKGQRVRWAALLPEDRVSFGAYKMRIYLGSDEMPSPSEQRLARASGGASRAVADRRVGPGAFPSSGKTELSPPSTPPRALPASFPEPSHDGSGPEWDSTYAESTGKPSVVAEPALMRSGFEIVDDSADSGSESGAVFEGGFELVDDDDDDEIIELE
jgi:hypothetical protein